MDDAEEIGGYRVLRRLARGTRADILLAHGGEPPDAVVIKRAPAGDPGALRELEALDRGAGEHVVRLVDVAADEEHLDLVLERLPGGDLARLLVDRSALEGGEAVTLLAPIAATVRRLHDAGVAHGALTPACIVFRDDGTPVLVGFGAAAVFASGATEVERERIDEVTADRAAIRRLASTVLGRVTGSRRRAAQSLAAEIANVPEADIVGMLEQRIFDVASARPVRAADEPTAPSAADPGGRLVPVAEPVADDGTPNRGGPPSGAWAQRVERLLERAPAEEARAALARRWSTLAPGRRRIVLAVGAGAAALLIAVVAIPGPSSGAAEATGTPAAGTGSPRPGGEPASASPGALPERPGDAVLRGDDPVAAASVLLAARADCRTQLSVLCLDGVDQDGSAAATADATAIRAAQGGGELGADPLAAAGDPAPQLRERLGGSALIGIAGGASMLLLRTPDGWRIRDIMAAPPAAS